MIERPILFSGAMVRALLAGTKTQTRRVAKHPLAQEAVRILSYHGQSEFDCVLSDETGGIILCPYGKPGDRLWVRETHWCPKQLGGSYVREKAKYRANYPGREDEILPGLNTAWKPSIHMPRVLSRILLEITAVRCERLQVISESDAKAEGIEPVLVPTSKTVPARKWTNYMGRGYCDGMNLSYPVESYQTLWASINGADSWAANPWVWVVEFKRVE